MLTSNFSEKEGKITILGDALDLNALHHTVRKIMLVILDYETADNDASNLLVSFLEKIEQAYLGKDLTQQLCACGRKLSYQGFMVNHPELVIIHQLLKVLSPYAILNEADQINLLYLERIITSVSEQNVYVCNTNNQQNIKNFIKDFAYKVSKSGSHQIFTK